MPLTVPCRKCKKKFPVRSKLAGKAVHCAWCGHSMVLPSLKRILERRRVRAAVRGAFEEPAAQDDVTVADTDDAVPVHAAATVACPFCQGDLCYEPDLAGQTVACPFCSGHLQMPRL